MLPSLILFVRSIPCRVNILTAYTKILFARLLCSAPGRPAPLPSTRPGAADPGAPAPLPTLPPVGGAEPVRVGDTQPHIPPVTLLLLRVRSERNGGRAPAYPALSLLPFPSRRRSGPGLNVTHPEANRASRQRPPVSGKTLNRLMWYRLGECSSGCPRSASTAKRTCVIIPCTRVAKTLQMQRI